MGEPSRLCQDQQEISVAILGCGNCLPLPIAFFKPCAFTSHPGRSSLAMPLCLSNSSDYIYIPARNRLILT